MIPKLGQLDEPRIFRIFEVAEVKLLHLLVKYNPDWESPVFHGEMLERNLCVVFLLCILQRALFLMILISEKNCKISRVLLLYKFFPEPVGFHCRSVGK